MPVAHGKRLCQQIFAQVITGHVKLAAQAQVGDRGHQVGAGHRDSILNALGIPIEKDYSTFEYLGNMGTVSLPLTAALAEERGFLTTGDRVGFLGIGSGLNCLMLGWEW